MRPDQERIQSLLKDTVSLLCKNGLHYSSEIKVEGLIGVTLDNQDVFLIHLNEKIDNDNVTERSTVEMQNVHTALPENPIPAKNYCVNEQPVENFTYSAPQNSSLLQINESNSRKRGLNKKPRKKAKKSKISEENFVDNSEGNLVNPHCKTETEETLIISDEDSGDDTVALKSEKFHESTITTIPKKEENQFEKNTDGSQEDKKLNFGSGHTLITNEHTSQIDGNDMKPQINYPQNTLPGITWENQASYLDENQDHFSHQQFNPSTSSQDSTSGITTSLQKTRRPSSIKAYMKEMCHECELCGKQYFHSGDLRRHERNIHKMKKINVNGNSYFQKVD